MIRRQSVCVRALLPGTVRCVSHHECITAPLTPADRAAEGTLTLCTGTTGPKYSVSNKHELQRVIYEAMLEGYIDERRALNERLQQTNAALEPLEIADAAIKASCKRHSNRMMKLCGLALAAQFAVLSNWVFVIFDWNLVEPVTYFLGYTVVWWSLVFYNKTGKEFTYDSIIAVLEQRKREKLLASRRYRNFSPTTLEQLRAEASSIKAKLGRM